MITLVSSPKQHLCKDMQHSVLVAGPVELCMCVWEGGCRMWDVQVHRKIDPDFSKVLVLLRAPPDFQTFRRHCKGTFITGFLGCQFYTTFQISLKQYLPANALLYILNAYYLIKSIKSKFILLKLRPFLKCLRKKCSLRRSYYFRGNIRFG